MRSVIFLYHFLLFFLSLFLPLSPSRQLFLSLVYQWCVCVFEQIREMQIGIQPSHHKSNSWSSDYIMLFSLGELIHQKRRLPIVLKTITWNWWKKNTLGLTLHCLAQLYASVTSFLPLLFSYVTILPFVRQLDMVDAVKTLNWETPVQIMIQELLSGLILCFCFSGP